MSKKKWNIIQHPQIFYQYCGENDCKFPQQDTSRMDPVLKLFYGCPVMLTKILMSTMGWQMEQKRFCPTANYSPIMNKSDCFYRR